MAGSLSVSQYSDEAYVLFKEGHGLNKITHRNAEIPMLYVIDNGQKFAIADVDDDTNVIHLGFEAKTRSQYQLSFKTDGDFSSLHLIDNLTGNDVDMLIENEYSFLGTPQDINARFTVRLKDSGNTENADVFAYQSGSDIIVYGKGTLQVFDIVGRMVSSIDLNGVQTISTSSLQTGVYLLRIIGNDVKTQKIIVK